MWVNISQVVRQVGEHCECVRQVGEHCVSDRWVNIVCKTGGEHCVSDRWVNSVSDRWMNIEHVRHVGEYCQTSG